MDTIFIILGLLVAGIVLAGLALKAGFSVKSKAVQPDGLADEKPPVETLPLPADLPESVQRFYRAVYGSGEIPAPRTLAAYGTGRFRVRKLPLFGYMWAPLTWTIYMTPGGEFAWKMRMNWFSYPVVVGGDGYLKERGLFKMGKQTLDGEHMDYSEQVMLWIHTLIFAPGALLALPSVAWEALDDQRARVTIEQTGRSLSYDLTFNPENHLLARIDTQRPGSRTGNLFSYSYTLTDQALFNEDLTLPDQLSAAWEEDVYNEFVLEGIQYNAPIVSLMEHEL